MKSFYSLSILLSLFACQSISSGDASHSKSSTSDRYEDTSAFTFEGFKSHAWVSDKFTGRHSRQINGDILMFTADQSAREGGLDIGLSKPLSVKPVRKVKDGTAICSSYDIELSGEGRWWAGPKISVNWQGEESAKQNGDDWYENYIVETASTPPDALHDILTGDYFSPEILPDTGWAGATYRNYKIRFHDWWQFWSVRQDYRASGTVPIKPVLDLWVQNGMPDHRQFDGVKANIETYGAVSGTGRISVDVTTDAAKTLDCAI